MSLTDIFQDSHGNFNESHMFPVVAFDGEIEKGFGLSSMKDHVELLKEKVPHLVEDIYFNIGSVINHFCYYKDNVYIDIFTLEWEHWGTFHQQERIEYWIDEMEKKEKENDYESIFGVMEKKILIDRYIHLFDDIPKKQKYEIFRDLWRRSEYGFDNFDMDFLKEVFKFKRYSSSYVEAYNKLKEKLDNKKQIEIYRGTTEKSTPFSQTVSWTLEESVAEFFATRFNSKRKRIYKATVNVNDIQDYLYERSEDELLILPQHILNMDLHKEL